MKKEETNLQNKIIVALCERGCFAVNHTVGKFYTEYGAVVHIGVPGESDIWGHLPDGKAFYLEVKLPGEEPRENQYDFICAMRNTGAISGWCTSVEEGIDTVFNGKDKTAEQFMTLFDMWDTYSFELLRKWHRKLTGSKKLESVRGISKLTLNEFFDLCGEDKVIKKIKEKYNENCT